MDAFEKKLTEVISRASDALEEYDHAKNNTDDYSEVRDLVSEMRYKVDDIRRKSVMSNVAEGNYSYDENKED